MKSYQIAGEVVRHMRKLFSPHLFPYPKATMQFHRICFLHKKGGVAASAYLRAQQLCEIASGLIDTCHTDNTDQISDHSVVIGTKGALDQLAMAIDRCRTPHTRFFYDPVDQLLPPSDLNIPDGFIASSYRQYLWLRTQTPKPVFLLPHHADRRIKQHLLPEAEFGVAYFGARKNAFICDSFEQKISIFEAHNHNATAWMDHLTDYPLHYCVRRKPEKSHAYNPATKLFVAAKVGAAVITTRDESDAEMLLPPDYPFFCASRSEKAVNETIAFAREAFRTPIFAKAVADVEQIRGWREEEQIQQLKLMLSLA